MNVMGAMTMGMIFIVTIGAAVFVLYTSIKRSRTREDLPEYVREAERLGVQQRLCISFTNEYTLIYYGNGSEAIPTQDILWIDAAKGRRNGVAVKVHVRDNKSKFFAAAYNDYIRSNVKERLHTYRQSAFYTDWNTPRGELREVMDLYRSNYEEFVWKTDKM